MKKIDFKLYEPKKIADKMLPVFMVIIISCIVSCQNQPWEFDDYDYSSCYFPYQYPVRTLVLGDYLFDNENDNNHQFLITGLIGGVYENKTTQFFEYEIDESLVKDLKTPNGDPLRVLPSNYYTLDPVNRVTIPKGSLRGQIRVQLTNDFFNDPLSVAMNYVIPLKITTASTDSILCGKTIEANADPRVESDWVVLPMNFTLFGIKYINIYHGAYLYRGISVIKDVTNQEIERIVYRKKQVEDDEVMMLNTVNMNTIKFTAPVRLSTGSPGNFIAHIEFAGNGNCTIKETEESAFAVTGTGKFVENGGKWGGENHHAIFLEYDIQNGGLTHSIKDTLVVRDRNVSIETFAPVFE